MNWKTGCTKRKQGSAEILTYSWLNIDYILSLKASTKEFRLHFKLNQRTASSWSVKELEKCTNHNDSDKFKLYENSIYTKAVHIKLGFRVCLKASCVRIEFVVKLNNRMERNKRNDKNVRLTQIKTRYYKGVYMKPVYPNRFSWMTRGNNIRSNRNN